MGEYTISDFQKCSLFACFFYLPMFEELVGLSFLKESKLK